MEDGTRQGDRAPSSTWRRRSVQDWEEWEDDEVSTPNVVDESQPLQEPHPIYSRERATKKLSTLRVSRHASSKMKRLRSRRRQKAQNAKAGIKLVTDMSVFGRGNQPSQQDARPMDAKPVKFVDAAALRALEGQPSSASVGNWNWFNRHGSPNPNRSPPQPQQSSPAQAQELSPEDRPIVIGISLPPDQASSHNASPLPTTSEREASQLAPQIETRQHVSAWSPDTPDTVHSFALGRAVSSVYSQGHTPRIVDSSQVPPVPALPIRYQKESQQTSVNAETSAAGRDDDDSGTPCTLFEEDGTSPGQRQTPARGLGISPGSATSRSHGWWDHVVTPFLDKSLSFSARKIKVESPKRESRPPRSDPGIKDKFKKEEKQPHSLQAPIVRKPIPRRGSPPLLVLQQSDSFRSAMDQSLNDAANLPSVKRIDSAVDDGHQAEQPPPYSPPEKREAAQVKYRAFLPSQDPVNPQLPWTCFPASPGLAATMSSQGAGQMTDIPLTPTMPSQAPPSSRSPLPTRPPHMFVSRATAFPESSRPHRIEQQRRRHEKEEVIARRVGGFWRGRACVPAAGCFGRSGREGRRRRRLWLLLFTGILALVALIPILAVLLSRHNREPPVPQSIWVNLTGFPPMPTGALTVVGPENSVSRSACTEPSTLWSCSLPKDQHDTVAPYKPNQPTVVLKIQWPNGSKNSTNRQDTKLTRRGTAAASWFRSTITRRQSTPKITPEPKEATPEEMWFLGNTTDNIMAEDKAGEPTPFFISLVNSAKKPEKGQSLTRRESAQIGSFDLKKLLPAPDMEPDGTLAPAVMLPSPSQQPVRLFDRGLPTEHYGFYSHFKRSIFVKSTTILNRTDDNIPLDQDGGCRKNEADYLVTWGETRVLVQIWTRALELNSSSLLRRDDGRGVGGVGEVVRPGTMPYPVTVTLDTHGGDPVRKLVWSLPLDKRQRVSLDKAELLVNNMGTGGTWINPRGAGDPKMGGFDGGTGGCKCEWVNWVGRT
ncbi:hypothetical protein HIM_01795 [Hirsutella minnesotensis 3608]|nr:hypothetical protein HIM_01795 [Hirsutella minnesotensis 3608]